MVKLGKGAFTQDIRGALGDDSLIAERSAFYLPALAPNLVTSLKTSAFCLSDELLRTIIMCNHGVLIIALCLIYDYRPRALLMMCVPH